jgi:hypothetical protein
VLFRSRFRMDKEHPRFSQEIRLIPRRLVLLIGVAYLAAMVVAQIVMHYQGPAWSALNDDMNRLALAGAVTISGMVIASLVFLIGYVNRDAKRRGMNSGLWTLLVIVLLPAYLATGFIIYFLLREPLPYNCPHCGALVNARFNYCPACQFNLRPSCSQCRREVRLSDRYCPHCASELAPGTAGIPTA